MTLAGRVLVLGVVAFAFSALAASPSLAAAPLAQEGKPSGPGGPPYPGESQITFEWDYSCLTGKGCSFSCPGTGGASHVTKLSLHLGTIPVGDSERVAGVFYVVMSCLIRVLHSPICTCMFRWDCVTSFVFFDTLFF